MPNPKTPTARRKRPVDCGTLARRLDHHGDAPVDLQDRAVSDAPVLERLGAQGSLGGCGVLHAA